MALLLLPPSVARFNREHYLSHLYNAQNSEQFAKLFDDTMRSLAGVSGKMN
jgi:type I restriction enzyme M protein